MPLCFDMEEKGIMLQGLAKAGPRTRRSQDLSKFQKRNSGPLTCSPLAFLCRLRFEIAPPDRLFMF